MKDVTLKEFIVIAKDSEELKNRIAECVKASNGGKVSDGLANIAAGAGYQLTDFNLPMSSMPGKGRILTDTEMGIINGGVEPTFDRGDLCEAIFGFLGFDTSDCYDWSPPAR